MISDEFCGGEFWDPNVSWYTVKPDLTQCFQKTVLIWFPCGLLWFMSVIEIKVVRTLKKPKLPWTFLNVTKIILSIWLLACSIAELGLYIYHQLTVQYVPTAFFLASVMKITSYVLVLVLMFYHRIKGKRSSSVLFIFWFFTAVCDMVAYRSTLLSVFDQEYSPISASQFLLNMLTFPVIFCMMVFSAVNDCKETLPNEVDNPLDDSPFLSRLTFSWCDGLILKGYRGLISMDNFSPLHEDFVSKNVFRDFLTNWSKQLRKVGIFQFHPKPQENGVDRLSVKIEQPKKPSLTMALIYAFWKLFAIGSVLEGLFVAIRFMPPLVLNLIIDFVSSDEPMWRGYIYSIAIFLASIASNFIVGHAIYYDIAASIQVKSALNAAIYRKSLRMSNSARKDYAVGELVNLMAVDSDKIFNFIMFANLLWGAPLRVIITIVLLWQYLGPSCLAGVAAMIILLPITGVISRQNQKVQEIQMEEKDKRLRHMNEILNGIKVLKLYAWELPFMDQIMKIRDYEVQLIRKFQYLNAGISFTWSCSPFLICVCSFVTYLLVDENNILDATTAFVSLTLFSMLRFSLVMIPHLISTLIQINVSLKRLNKFFLCEELDPGCVGNIPEPGEAITVEDGAFTWSRNDPPFLNHIDLNVRKGHLVAIVGQVGSGKSSLLSAILGDMDKLSGAVNVQGSRAYVPQQAWIRNATLRQNILFLKSFDSTVYEKVLDGCCLRPDLAILPGGDLTEIGEKGVNLSGGQKQRINLARAVYQNSDIYLFDDPLSAVDAHVGKHIFEHIVGPKGMLRRKTRILVTHDISILPDVDIIVTMKNGKICEVGNYEKLMDLKGDFAEFVQEHLKKEKPEDESDIDTPDGERNELRFRRFVSQISYDQDPEKFSASRQTSRQMSKRSGSIMSLSEEFTETKKATGLLMEEEKMEVGKVKGRIYIDYLKSCNLKIVFLTFLGYAGYQAFDLAGNLWLSEWTSDKPLPDGTQDVPLRNKRIIVYVFYGIGGAAFLLFGCMMLAVACTTAAKMFHHRMLQSIIRAPMSFFDTTPLGRVLNRFGKDLDDVDIQIPSDLDGWLSCLLFVLGTIIIISMNNPFFLIAAIPLSFIYYFLQVMYITSSRQIKRLKSVTRSPIYSHFQETVHGASTIRAYRAQNNFMKDSDLKVDTNQLCEFYATAVNRWLGIRLDCIGSCIIFATALFSVASRGTVDPGIVGLSMTYALTVTDALTWAVRMAAELETKIVSVERIKEYSEITPEAPWDLPEKKPALEWPETGALSFVDYSTRYREGLDLVLDGISVDIHPKERIGVVGRTGAGKSSLTLSLFRIIEGTGGRIIVDNVDISQIGLHDLRPKLTIIPQDPVLFTGPLRMNLDPDNSRTDEAVWEALEHAHLKAYVKSLPEGLNHSIAEGGENLSVGQRQLVCLARALLRKTKILVLDEATAAVDMETDKLIQNTIREEFNDCTVITIAHRLYTIMDYDRVIVMSNGKIVELGSPPELTSQRDSQFHSMAKDAGLL